MAKVLFKYSFLEKFVLIFVLVISFAANQAQASGCVQIYEAPPSEKLRVKAGPVFIKVIDLNGKLGLRVMVKDALDEQNVAGADTSSNTIAMVKAFESENETKHQFAQISLSADATLTVLYSNENDSSEKYFAIIKNNQITCGELPTNATQLFQDKISSNGLKTNQAEINIDSEDKIAGLFGLSH